MACSFVGGQDEIFKAILMEEYRTHSAATVQDYYKFIHQASMGPGHWKMDPGMALQYLRAEIRTLTKDSTQPLCQFLSPDSELIRINLRPYLAMNGDIDSLAEAFAQTSNNFQQSEKALETDLTLFISAVRKKKIPLSLDTVQSYIRRMRKEHFPAVHHSPQYEETYKPAYRVVFRKYLPVNIRYATHKN